MNLKDKVVIVAGGGRDIGRAISIRLGQEGAKVFVIYFNDEATSRDTVETIKKAGGTAVLHHANLTKVEEIESTVKAAVAAFGDKIDVLVNVTGGMVARKTLADIDEDFVDFVMGLNFKSTVLMTKAVLPHLPQGGVVVNFSSQAGRDGGGFGSSIYAASKGAVATFTRAMAKELGPRGIRVNALCPGMIATSFHDIFSKPEIRVAVAGATPLRREGAASEVAGVVAYLASEDAAFVTGVCLDINGGTLFS
jgi:3-oxoacyl-[acyl-carrier protein] reductase